MDPSGYIFIRGIMCKYNTLYVEWIDLLISGLDFLWKPKYFLRFIVLT